MGYAPFRILHCDKANRFLKPQNFSLGLALCLILAGCYPLHAMHGHFDLMAKRQPVADIVADATASDDLKMQLQRAVAMRGFASRELGLPDNGSYRNYAQLDRDFPVWNVWITPEFDLQPRLSCFPVIGCVPYRGYYSKQAADAYAAGFRTAGDDVMVGGVTAYSTLGWFDDPVTSTMLRMADERLAGLLFHELAHQVVYVKNNATFNESFARAVEIEGTLRWLESQGDSAGTARYRTALARADDFFASVKAAREQLAVLYDSQQSPEAKRRGKAQILSDLRETQRQRKTLDSIWSAYDPWFAGDLNNARLAAVTTYYDEVAMFRDLLRESNGDFSAFYTAVQTRASGLK
jgi:predicted aminopeptidase